jgi:Ni/Co efflux regulator RcnB
MKKLVLCILALVFMCGCTAGLATDYAPMDFSEKEAYSAELCEKIARGDL